MKKSTEIIFFSYNNLLLLDLDNYHNEIITVEQTEKGVRLKEVFKCEQILK